MDRHKTRDAIEDPLADADRDIKLKCSIEERIKDKQQELIRLAKQLSDLIDSDSPDYEKIAELLFIDSDTNILIHAAKTAGAMEELFDFADIHHIELSHDALSLKHWTSIVNPT